MRYKVSFFKECSVVGSELAHVLKGAELCRKVEGVNGGVESIYFNSQHGSFVNDFAAYCRKAHGPSVKIEVVPMA